MNLLKTNINGGFPLFLDDIRYLSGGFETAISDFLKGIHETFFISGCAVTVTPGSPDTLVHTAGVVSFKGEICTVDALVAPLNISTYVYLTKVTTYDPAGNKVFESAASNDTYQINKVAFGSGVSVPSGSVDVTNVYSFGKAAANLAFVRDTYEIASDALTEIDNAAITAEYVSGDELKYIDSTVKILITTFLTTDATPLITVKHNAGSVPAGHFPILSPDGFDWTIRDGESAIFINDGTGFRIIGGMSGNSSDWTLIPFNVGSTGLGLADPAYRKVGGMTYIRAGISVIGTTPFTVFNLPAGYRPIDRITWRWINPAGHEIEVTVDPSGDVKLDNITAAGVGGYMYLGHSFPAEQ